MTADLKKEMKLNPRRTTRRIKHILRWKTDNQNTTKSKTLMIQPEHQQKQLQEVYFSCRLGLDILFSSFVYSVSL